MGDPEQSDNEADATRADVATGEGMPEPPRPPAGQPGPPASPPGEPPAADPVGVSTPAPPPAIADDTIRHLDERYVEMGRTTGVIVTAVIGAINLIGGIGVPAIAGAPVWVLVLLAIGCGGVTILAGYLFYRWPAIEHPYHSYQVNPRGIEIHHGVWFRSVVNVARSRIQHTDVSQGPIERRYGLATLHIHTAGTEQAEVTLPGLDHQTALAIRDYLVTGGADDAV